MRDLGRPLLAMVVVGLGIFGLFSGRPIERPAGVLVPTEPEQVSTQAPAFQVGDYELVPMAEYHIVARVLSVEAYNWDGGSALSPLDFAVGWGPMSDTSVLAHFRVTQGGRFFTIYPDAQAIDIPTALLASANMHLVPSDAAVRRQLQRVRPGHVVDLHGKLINASRPDGYHWNSSLTRADTGAGACELLYVEAVSMK